MGGKDKNEASHREYNKDTKGDAKGIEKGGHDIEYANDGSETGLGTNGRELVKAFAGKPSHSERYEEHFEEVLDVYRKMGIMCGVTDAQKRKAMTIPLKGPARSIFARHARHLSTNDETAEWLHRRFIRQEKQQRILNEWKGMLFTDAMRHKPDECEVTVFQSFAARAAEIQGQLSEDYQADR